jgi:hypothetical protein
MEHAWIPPDVPLGQAPCLAEREGATWCSAVALQD